MKKKIQIIVIISIFLISINCIGVIEGKDSFKIGRFQKNVVKCGQSLASLSYFPEFHDFGDMEKGQMDSTTFNIWNSGCCSLVYSLSESCNWIDADPKSGYSYGEHNTITVSIDTTGLSVGSYQCDVSITSNGGNGVYSVYVNVVAATTPVLYYYPFSYDFGDMLEGVTDSTTFEIWNSGCCVLNYNLYENQEWVEVNSTSGSSTGEHDIITVSIDTSDLAVGLHKCNISIQSSSGNGNFTVIVNIVEKSVIDITVEEAWNLLNDTSNGIQTPIDVRTESEWKNEHIDTPYPENPRHHNYLEWNNPNILDNFISTYEGKEIILYCKLGGRSSSAASILVENEFNGEIYNMLGGITEWKNQGYPTIGYTTFEITDFRGGIGSVSFNIKNNGTYTGKNISYNIRVNGGFLSGINLTYTCSDCITQLEPEATITESTNKAGLIFGFGPIDISVSVWAKNAEDITIIKQGFVFGIFVLIR